MQNVTFDADARVPIKSWCSDIESSAMQQAVNLSKLPFAFKHIALMPDTHMGYGMPIGGILATKGVIIPQAIGYDIGCGVNAVKTSFIIDHFYKDKIKAIMGEIKKVVPVGFKHHKHPKSWAYFDEAPDIPIIQQELNSARKQIGTLGGGNHFIELQIDAYNDNLWIMIHSGSRNFGLKIAKEYHEKAKKLCEKYYSDIPTKELSFLPIDSDEGQEYISCMNFALRFAEASRCMMMNSVLEIVESYFKSTYVMGIDCHHNYAAMENHFGSNVMLHRKGAILARKGHFGIIPGSQGTSSFIVKGKGNADSFNSCSHGAGRAMSRTKARNELDLDKEIKELNDKGIVHSIRNKKDLDEASGAYKDINQVMKQQEDLVDIFTKLEPLGVIKA